ncbi:hypothetical protein HF324_30410 [Chitinophaga oryzae]|uniref:DUF4919 domain-containing protein n=1 Tax=Chitinophaga oryzae TaxID=2725414 RepID=A0AAE7DAF9_9BACT|nr:hypothetical protein [Chitinophaga oryzae]QJB35388.1 hypothetical protein HF329_30425 [Chitinophaga oryzae]QJB41924.1 hypothetical protein HF324_30410 [Chitinophaga oryzae]
MRCLLALTGLLFITTAVSAQQEAWRIVPGESIGHVKLEMPANELASLGKPDTGDAAMMKAWRIWYGRRKDGSVDSAAVLAVFTAMRTQDTQYVKEVRVTSRRFRTAENVGAGSAMTAVRKAYPNLKLVKVYASKNRSRRIEVYDDEKLGIAFETASARRRAICSMVVVHTPGEAPGSYLDYHIGFDNLLPVTR